MALHRPGDWAIVDVAEVDGTMRRVPVVHPDPEKQVLARRLDPGWPPERDGPLGIPAVMRTRVPQLTADVTRASLAGAANRGEQRLLLRRLGITSAMTVPLVVGDEVLGAITFLSERAGDGYSDEDLALVEELSATCARGIHQMRVVEDLKRSVLLRDQVLGYVSHDLKNPLGAIMLTASQLVADAREQSGAASVERQLEAAERILTATVHMQRLIGDLLEVAQIGAGGFIIERHPVHVSELVEELRCAYDPTVAAHSLQLEVRVERELPVMQADAGRLTQVFENLLENAIKFTPPGGTVSIGAAPLHESVLFSVSDTGVGIREQDMPRLFDRFWQSRRPGVGSAGLGLAISKGIVAAHGGILWAESVVGQGSTFYFRIPVAGQQAASARPGHPVS